MSKSVTVKKTFRLKPRLPVSINRIYGLFFPFLFFSFLFFYWDDSLEGKKGPTALTALLPF